MSNFLSILFIVEDRMLHTYQVSCSETVLCSVASGPSVVFSSVRLRTQPTNLLFSRHTIHLASQSSNETRRICQWEFNRKHLGVVDQKKKKATQMRATANSSEDCPLKFIYFFLRGAFAVSLVISSLWSNEKPSCILQMMSHACYHLGNLTRCFESRGIIKGFSLRIYTCSDETHFL